MLIAIRYEKGLNNNILYFRLRNVSNQFYSFTSNAWVALETTLGVRRYLTELPDSDPLESLYIIDIQLPSDTMVIKEVVDHRDLSVIGLDVPTSPDDIAINSTIEAIAIKTNTLPTLSQIESSSILAKEITLQAKASQASVNAIPLSPLLTSDIRLDTLDAKISTRASSTAVSNIPTNTLLSTDPRLDAIAITESAIGDIGSVIDIIANDISDIKVDIGTILDVQTGNWEIKNNQMIFYKANGIELMRFNLRDKQGTLSEDRVFKREKV